MSEDSANPILTLTLDQLNAFLRWLKVHDMEVGPDRLISVNRLLLPRLGESGVTLDSSTFKRLLAPLVCTSSREQETFGHYFDQHFVPPTPHPIGECRQEATVSAQVADGKPPMRQKRRLIIPLIAIMLVLGGVLLITQIGPIGEPIQVQDATTPEISVRNTELPEPLPPAIPVVTHLSKFSPDPYILVVLLFLVFWIVRRFAKRRSNWLRGVRGDSSDAKHKVYVAPPLTSLFAGSGFQRLFRGMARHTLTITRKTDVDASVQTTIRRGGIPDICYQKKARKPEYLMLIDRSGLNQHQVHLMTDCADRLRDSGGIIEIFWFLGDARGPFRNGKGNLIPTIREMADQFYQHRVILVMEDLGIIPPFMVSPYAQWNNRSLVTFRPLSEWGYREILMQNAGFQVVPANRIGLILLGDWMAQAGESGDVLIDLAQDTEEKLLPEVLQRQPDRWTKPFSPGWWVTRKMLSTLKGFLGDFHYAWLSACAVYPEIRWDMTAHLGAALAEKMDRPIPTLEDHLLLARLPWLQVGAMPEYLRLRLMKGMPGDELRRIRGLLLEWIDSTHRQRQRGDALEITPEATIRAQGGDQLSVVFMNGTLPR